MNCTQLLDIGLLIKQIGKMPKEQSWVWNQLSTIGPGDYDFVSSPGNFKTIIFF